MENNTTATDSNILRMARQINTYQERIRELMGRIRESGHLGAQEMYQTFVANLFGHSASAIHCVWDYFNHPERWELSGADIERVASDARSGANSEQ